MQMRFGRFKESTVDLIQPNLEEFKLHNKNTNGDQK